MLGVSTMGCQVQGCSSSKRLESSAGVQLSAQGKHEKQCIGHDIWCEGVGGALQMGIAYGCCRCCSSPVATAPALTSYCCLLLRT